MTVTLPDGHSLTDQVQTSCYSEPGDSGGIFFTWSTSTTASILGLASRRGVAGSVIKTYYSKIYNILGDSTLGISFNVPD